MLFTGIHGQQTQLTLPHAYYSLRCTMAQAELVRLAQLPWPCSRSLCNIPSSRHHPALQPLDTCVMCMQARHAAGSRKTRSVRCNGLMYTMRGWLPCAAGRNSWIAVLHHAHHCELSLQQCYMTVVCIKNGEGLLLPMCKTSQNTRAC